MKQTRRKRFLWSKQGLLFLLFAALIWTINTLSKAYTTLVPVVVGLQVNSDGVLLLSNSLNVQARMTASGFSILYRKTFPRTVFLNIDELSDLDLDNPRVSTTFLVDVYKQQYPSANDVERFIPLSVSLPITRTVKKSFIPKLLNSVALVDGYQLTAPITLSEDSIYAVGSASAIASIDAALFTVTSETPLREDFQLTAQMPDSIAHLVRWSKTQIDVRGTVDRYSDISFVLPLALVNAPDSLKLTISPKQVTVKFAAPLAELRGINASSLRAEAAFDATASGFLEIRVVGIPTTAKQLTIVPNRAAYLIIE